MTPRHPGRLPRLVRAGAVSAAVLGIAAAAHVEGGGSLPSPAASAVLLVGVLLTAATLTGRTLGPARLLALLGGGQVALHHLFGALSATSTCAPVELHRHHTVLLCGEAPAPAAHADAGLAMVLAHVLATLASAAVISHGETVLRFLLSWLRPLRETPRAAAAPVRLTPAPAAPGPLPRLTAYLASPPLRGPPLALAA